MLTRLLLSFLFVSTATVTAYGHSRSAICHDAYGFDSEQGDLTALEEVQLIGSLLRFSTGAQTALKFYGRPEVETIGFTNVISRISRPLVLVEDAPIEVKTKISRLHRLGIEEFAQEYLIKRSKLNRAFDPHFGGVKSCNQRSGIVGGVLTFPEEALRSDASLISYLDKYIEQLTRMKKRGRDRGRASNKKVIDNFPLEVQTELNRLYDLHGTRMEIGAVPSDAIAVARSNNIRFNDAAEADEATIAHEATHNSGFRNLHTGSTIAAAGRKIGFLKPVSSGDETFYPYFVAEEYEARLRQMGVYARDHDTENLERTRKTAETFAIAEEYQLLIIRVHLGRSDATLRKIQERNGVSWYTVVAKDLLYPERPESALATFPVPQQTLITSGLHPADMILQIVEARLAYLGGRPNKSIGKKENKSTEKD